MSVTFKSDIGDPFVSILMPAYNAEKYISQSIKSVVEQVYSNWELIIVNDGSKDHTLDIAKKWSDIDPRIRVLCNDINQGLGFATNRALQNAKGKFIAKLDADDLAAKDWLSSRVQYLFEHPALVAVSGSRLLINDKGRKLKKLNEAFLPEAVSWRLIFGNPVIHPGILFRSFDGIQYSDIRYLEDWDLWSQLICKGGIEIINDHRISYRVHSHNTSASIRKEVFLPVIGEIVNRQLSGFTDIRLQPEMAWYLYRDRPSFRIERARLNEAARILIELFSKFLQAHPEMEERVLRQLKLSFWDELLHLMRSGKIDWKLIAGSARTFGLSLSDLAGDRLGRYIAAKAVYLCLQNFFLR